MRTLMIAVAAAVFYLSAQSAVSAQTESKSFVDRFAGVWTAPPAEVRLNSDFEVSVWGPNAVSVRKVELTIQPSGQGTITVTRSVVDGHQKTVRASVSVEEAQLRLRAPDTLDPNRIEPVVEVLKPERRYPDNPNDHWPLDGLVVKLSITDPQGGSLNLRFDLPDGRGSFGETLVRGTRPADRRPVSHARRS